MRAPILCVSAIALGAGISAQKFIPPSAATQSGNQPARYPFTAAPDSNLVFERIVDGAQIAKTNASLNSLDDLREAGKVDREHAERERTELRNRVSENFTRVLVAGVLLVFFMPAVRLFRDYASDWLMARLLVDLQGDLGAKLLRLPLGHHVRESSGDYLARLSSDAAVAVQIPFLKVRSFSVPRNTRPQSAQARRSYPMAMTTCGFRSGGDDAFSVAATLSRKMSPLLVTWIVAWPKLIFPSIGSSAWPDRRTLPRCGYQFPDDGAPDGMAKPL